MITGDKGVKLYRLPPVEQLTPVEAKIWEMLKAGNDVNKIATDLGMKTISVRRRMPIIKEKLACQ